MNPNIDRMPPAEMRSPGFAPGTVPESAGVLPMSPEKPIGAEAPMTQQPLPSSIPVAPLMAPTMQQSAPATTMPTDPNSTQSVGSTQQDELSIEKEYISKAKAMLSQTRSDPYQQANELSKIKAEFLKKRYGKDIKINEGRQ